VTIDSEYEITAYRDVAAYLESCCEVAAAQKVSNAFVAASRHRAVELAAQNAQIIGTGPAALSPDGALIAVVAGADPATAIDLFDAAHAVVREQSRYAPWLRTIVGPAAERTTPLAFSADGKTVVRGRAQAFDVATGEPRALPTALATTPAPKLSNRYSRRDGIRLP
jgi:hypothetical protein